MSTVKISICEYYLKITAVQFSRMSRKAGPDRLRSHQLTSILNYGGDEGSPPVQKSSILGSTSLADLDCLKWNRDQQKLHLSASLYLANTCEAHKYWLRPDWLTTTVFSSGEEYRVGSRLCDCEFALGKHQLWSSYKSLHTVNEASKPVSDVVDVYCQEPVQNRYLFGLITESDQAHSDLR